MSFMSSLLGGGAPSPPIVPQDTAAIVAQRERQAQEAKDQAIKDRQQRARTGGMYSLFNQATGALGVQSNQTLGGTA